MIQKFGITEAGFLKMNMEDIIESIENRMRTKGYNDFEVDPYSLEGNVLGACAYQFELLWNGLEESYNSRYYDSSYGIQLDRHGKNLRVPRIMGKYATTTLEFITDTELTIPKGTFVRIKDTNLNYYTAEKIDIDTSFKGTIKAIAENIGKDYNTNTGTITEMVNGIVGVLAVKNITPASGGDGVENDTSYRKALKDGELAKGGSTVNAIATSLRSVPLVNAVLVRESVGDEVDLDGIPPGAIKCFIDGIKSIDIAVAIHKHVAASIKTVGDIIYQVENDGGQPVPIRFSEFNKKTLYVQVKIISSDVSIDNIRQDIINVVNEYIDMCNFSEYKKIVKNQIESRVYSVSDSILELEVKLGENQLSLGTDNIDIGTGVLYIPSTEVVYGLR